MIDAILHIIFLILIILHASWIVLFFYHKKYQGKEKYVFPRLSIIIPAHNEEVSIKRTVQCVLTADYPVDREVIVVNDGSVDGTEGIVREMSIRDDRIKIYNTKHAGKANAINLGVKNAVNDIIVALDADSELKEDALIEIMKPFTRGRVGAVSGIIRAIDSRNPITWFQDFEYILTSGWRFLCNKIKGTHIFPGFVAIKKEALLKVGGFSGDTLSEDFDIAIRLKKEGYELAMSNATIYTRVPETVKGLIRQRLRWGRGTIQVMKKHYDVILNKRYGTVGLYVIPTQVYWYIHGFVYVPIVMYQVFGGYFQYFAAYKNFFSFEVMKYFFGWFTAYGMVEYTYKTFGGMYDANLLFFLLLTMFVLYITYDILILLKFASLRLRYLFVIFFFFPYSLFTLSLNVYSCIHEVCRPGNSNVWEKSR
ncbi:MAG: glycosyltransferase [Candidatus Altiarchaeota archaeon]|nr:glycosyltransferase [Candidatus Altiarchaeota archaeon]